MRYTPVALKALVILTLLPLLSLTNWTSNLAGPLSSPTVTIPSSKRGNAANANRAWLSNLATGPASNPTEAEVRAAVVENYARLPLSFEANQGQTDPTVKFLSHGNNYDLFLTTTESVLVLDGPSSKDSAALKSNRPPAKRRRAVLRIKLAGANPNAQVEGLDEQQGKSNYFIGKDAGKWRTNIANYAGVQYRSAYPGVDLIYRGNEQRIEFDFVVAAGADFRKIKLGIEGAKKMRLDADGDLVLTTSVGEVRQHKPFVYQEVDGARRAIDSRYVFSGRRQVAFEIGDYDAGKPLVIDPVLDYSTFLGGTSSDEGRSIVLDGSGAAYITGHTTSFNFPTNKGDFDTTYANSFDVFVTKLNAAGSSLVYSTYIGGNSEDSGFGIAVDSSSNAYITGSTSSSDYPTTPGAFDTTYGGGCCPGDGFVTKLNSTGTALVYSTYLGGSSSDQAAGIAVDSSSNVYVTGFTESANFPSTPGAFQTTNQGGSFMGDAFITKLNNTGTSLIYSTFLGGTRSDQGAGIVVDSVGRAFVAGSTNSIDFDVTAGAFQTTFGGSSSSFSDFGDAFVTELNETGTALVYSTYVGGTGDDSGLGIALNADGEAFICGNTNSLNYPITPGVVRGADGGMAKSSNSASSWAPINAGLTDSTILSIAIDPLAPATVYTGTNASGVFKSTNGGISWGAKNSGLTNFTIKSLAIDPTTPSTVYLGTNGRGVFKSHDGGNSWNAVNTGQGGAIVSTLVIDPSNSSIIYAATDSGVFKTINGGASWSGVNTGLNNTFITSMAIDPVTTGTLYVGTFGGVFITRNGGQNWTAAGLSSGFIRTLRVDPLAHSRVYAGSDTGVSKSTDEGVTWRGVNVGLTNRTVNSLAISSAIYAGTGNGVFKSTDGGGVWSPASTGIAGSVVNVITIDPSVQATLYAGTAFGEQDGFVTRLTAAGAALVYSTYLGGSEFDTCNSIALDPASNAYVTGQTSSDNFPTTPGVFQALSGFDTDAYVTKLIATGAGFGYSTFLGGNSFDVGYGITANPSGNAYVTGVTNSSDFRTTPGAFQTLMGGVANNFSADAFIAKLNQTPNLLADLRLTLTGPSGTITPGSFLRYDITLVNDGPDPAFSILITNELPPSMSFSFCNTNNGSCLGSGNMVTFTINSLAPGATVNATVFANGTCSLVDGATVTNTATVDSPTPDPNSSNNVAEVSNQASNPPPTIFPTGQGFPPDGTSGSIVNVSSSNSCSWSSVSNASWIKITFSTDCCNGIVRYDVAANPGPPRIGTMTIAGNTFTVTQSGAAVTTTIGVYLPSDRTFYLRNTNSPGFADVTTQYGPAGATPIVGDWNGDGVTTIGVYDPGSQTFYLRNSNTPGNADLTIQYGPPGAIPLAGDWDGNGTTTIGVYDPAARTFYLRNSNTPGSADLTIQYGPPSAVPVVGDWDGNGTTTIGVYDPAGRTFYLRNTNSVGFADLTIGYGPSGATPVVGDWDANGTVTIGVYDPANQTFYLRNSNTIGLADLTIRYGPPSARPLAGNWDGL